MKQPLLIRPLSESEQMILEQGLRSGDAFTLRRCQILLASAKGKRHSRIAEALSCKAQTVRNTIRAFEQEGLNCLQAQSTRPKTVRSVFDASKQEQLRALSHTNPRTLGKSRSTWTLDLLAQVCWEQGIVTKASQRCHDTPHA